MKALLKIEWIKTWRSWPVLHHVHRNARRILPLVFRYGNES